MRLKRGLIIGTCLELFAIVLANWQALGGIRTDEAKYLLNIPYPHPPLMRWIFSMTESLAPVGSGFQEMLWRLLLATLLVQAVWLVWDMTSPDRSGGASKGHMEDRMMVCAGWLLSAAVLTQAGTIAMAPIMAVQALALLWLRTRPVIVGRFPAWIGLGWLATVFTSYTGVLLFPLAWDALRRAKISRGETAVYVFGPVALLALYTLTNPLIPAIMLVHGNEGTGTGFATQTLGFARLWLIGGSAVASAVGTWGIVTGRDRPLLFSALLVSAYVFFSITPWYYAILFAPLFVGGLRNVFHERRHPHAFPLLSCLLFSSAIIVWFWQPQRAAGPARETMQAIAALQDSDEPVPPFEALNGSRAEAGTVLIAGSFGHEWQYESRGAIRRYRLELVKDATAIVCLNACDPMFDTSGWRRVPGVPAETWVRK